MISFEDAYRHVTEHHRDYGTEEVPLKEAVGRILATDVYADRDFPPFDRATKDGIVIHFDAYEKGRRAFEVDGVLAAGEAAGLLKDKDLCMEIMTGAVVPYDADTVIMYEEVEIDKDIVTIKGTPTRGQNIHRRGSDKQKGALMLTKDRRITPGDIGILASVGQSVVPVKKLPRVAVISTGDELVEIDAFPEPHQIRKSNAYQLYTALREEQIHPLLLHVTDDKDIIRQRLAMAVEEMDVLLLSGGVSKGKYDYIPKVMEELGIRKVFHRVLQQPGKPFWFGTREGGGTLIFSFPGNPVSTFANYYVYFKGWLRKSLGLPAREIRVFLKESLEVKGQLTRLVQARVEWNDGKLMAIPVYGNGSGDLTSLAETDGLIGLQPQEEPYEAGSVVPFYPTRNSLM